MGGRTKGLAYGFVFIDIISDTVFYCTDFSWRKGFPWKISLENWLEDDRKWHIKKVWFYSKQAEEDQALNMMSSCFFHL